ncbi:MAG: hypothetical protein WC307_06805 [Candidatus Nanoarchaeia archaeon]|jgi:hypothetical protein
MCEIELSRKCPRCDCYRLIMFSGSGSKGVCMTCGYEFPKELHYNEIA